jgi:CHASE2 domain-containing sensor protein
MHVVNLMPWSALVAVGAVEIVAGNRRLATFRPLAGGRRSARPLPRRRALTTGLAAVCLAAVLIGSWTPTLRHMLETRQEPPLWSATQWLANNVPRDRVLVVHDSIWTDLVHHYGFNPQPIIVYKLDNDPAVRKTLRRIDYLILPNWYYATPAGVAKYPTATEARKHAVAVARFGSGDDGVQIYRVSRYWRPT